MHTALAAGFAAILFLSCRPENEHRIAAAANAVTNNLNEPFLLKGIVDSSGKEIVPDFTGSDYTVIDFWNNGCPPCIYEMKQFAALLKGKENIVSVYSISINQFWLWKKTLQEHRGVFSFLQNDAVNWKQYNLMTADNPRYKNDVSTDRIREIQAAYNVTSYPAYFVINKTGKIIARPVSAVEYIKSILEN